MTTDELLKELASRGLRVEVRDGLPRLIGPKAQATPRLLAVLRWHKAEIIKRLSPTSSATSGDPHLPPKPPAGAREWLWRSGRRYTGDGTEPANWHPVGAWWFRPVGATGWQLIEGVVGDVAGFSLDALQRGAGLPAGEHLESAVPSAPGPQPEPQSVDRAGRRDDGTLLGTAWMFARYHSGTSGIDDG